MKLYLDEDLSPAIARILRERGVDARSAHEVGMIGASDDEQLDYGYREGRALVTRNARDFRIVAHRRIREQREHSGIVVCPPSIRGSEVRRIAERLITTAKGDDLHARRLTRRVIGTATPGHGEDLVKKLFDTIMPQVRSRPGGYTRILKIGFRRGDAAPMVKLELTVE